MLTFLFLFPVAGALLVQTMTDVSAIKRTTLIIMLIELIVGTMMWGEFDASVVGYQFVTTANASIVTLRLGVDSLSLFFILLNVYTLPICVLASWDNVRHQVKGYMIILLIIESLLTGVFMVMDLISFYVTFEAVLIPLFIMVGVWGATAARVRASFLLFLYTLFGSLFMLLAFAVIYLSVGSTDLLVLGSEDMDFSLQCILWLAIFLSFAVKTPLVPLHRWLVTAHVEAPVAGSMILAGVVLKLATYGILRILLPILPDASAYYAPIAMSLGVISVVYASFACLRQVDFKCLVAYSSVAHMGICILALFSNTVIGVEGAIMLGLGHGFVSPALFFIVGSVLYDRFHTRVIRYYRGLTVYMPIAMTFFFLFTLANMATPTTVNWIGEYMSLAGAYIANPVIAVIGSTSIVLSACYSIYLFNRLAFGGYSAYLTFTTDLVRREFLVLLLFLVPTVLLGLMPNVVLSDLHMQVSSLVHAVV